MFDSESLPPAPWYRLSRIEVLIGVVPAALAVFIAVVCFGSDTYLAVMAHGVVAILTLPGFVALELGRLILRRGSLMGDRWDLLSIPLSILVTLGMLRILRKLNTPFSSRR